MGMAPWPPSGSATDLGLDTVARGARSKTRTDAVNDTPAAHTNHIASTNSAPGALILRPSKRQREYAKPDRPPIGGSNPLKLYPTPPHMRGKGYLTVGLQLH